MIHTTTLIIRSAGERTMELCKKLILGQGVPENQIFVVQEVPFSAAMHKSFEIGIDEGRKWTFCVDADVLLRPGSIAHMIGEAEKQTENVCEIQGLVIDKYFGGPRPGGIHLYRTSLLKNVIKRIPKEGVNIRPEHHTLLSMAKDGFPWVQIPYIVGTHDDEQYNFDIYRKCFVQGVKHLFLADLFIPLWKRNMVSDSDFFVALQGFSDSLINIEDLHINSTQPVYHRGFRESGLREKEDLNTEKFSPDLIEKRIVTWIESEEYLKRFPDRFGLNTANNHSKKHSLLKRIFNVLKNRGVVKGLFYSFGKGLTILGEKIQYAISNNNHQ